MSLSTALKVGSRTPRTRNIPLSSREELSGGGYITVGRVTLSLRDERNASLLLRSSARVTRLGITGLVTLYDVTDGDVELASVTVSTTDPLDIERALSIADRSVERTYELRCGLVIGGTYVDGDALLVWSSSLELRG